jgi:CTP:molybdopterin cytidylyltransferase MocA
MNGNGRNRQFAAVVLAGDRSSSDPLVAASGRGCKALVDIDGTPMILRVLDALGHSAGVGEITICGPSRESVATEARLARLIAEQSVGWQPPQGTPSTSAWQALAATPSDTPVLLTTADHPLLRSDIIDHFCRAALATGADAVVGLAPYALVRELFPGMRKTVLRFSDDEYCGCNLFAFLTPAGRQMAERWRAVEAERKSPLKVMKMLGWLSVLRYRFGWLSLAGAERALSRRMGLRLAAVRMPFGDAAVDVDSLSDHELVQQRLRALRGAT